jgi:hypothetical protein
VTGVAERAREQRQFAWRAAQAMDQQNAERPADDPLRPVSIRHGTSGLSPGAKIS